ncbi:hydrolase [Agrobacterium larrymoorei]|uniref:Nicotinamidase-related amidase n=1 Tax=Agrobacterium larrymoorei TaxID=160699 RepID=A0ABU0UMN3_9HYPH|nr:hydrolase [Agrobacterium larrymoorei]MDQ1186223.1 nicotinamidase-related amidase [Agrobacterium larrymoorei]
MKQALYIVDVQPSFHPPSRLVEGIARLAATMPSIASVERHDESITPFERQLGWTPGKDDESLVAADRIFIKYGYAPPKEAVDYLLALQLDRVLVCGIHADTCVLAAGFSFFDAGLSPTLLPWLTVGSSLDRTGALGARLWKHHFGAVLSGPDEI